MTPLLLLSTLMTILMAVAVHRRGRRDSVGGFHDSVAALRSAVVRARTAGVAGAGLQPAVVPLPQRTVRRSAAE